MWSLQALATGHRVSKTRWACLFIDFVCVCVGCVLVCLVGFWDQGVYPTTSVIQGNPLLIWGVSLWEALLVVSHKWSFISHSPDQECFHGKLSIRTPQEFLQKPPSRWLASRCSVLFFRGRLQFELSGFSFCGSEQPNFTGFTHGPMEKSAAPVELKVVFPTRWPIGPILTKCCTGSTWWFIPPIGLRDVSHAFGLRRNCSHWPDEHLATVLNLGGLYHCFIQTLASLLAIPKPSAALQGTFSLGIKQRQEQATATKASRLHK